MGYTHFWGQSTCVYQNNHSTPECLKRSLNANMNNEILLNTTECQILGITISDLLFNVIVIKSEASGKVNIQIIKNNIGAVYQDKSNGY